MIYISSHLFSKFSFEKYSIFPIENTASTFNLHDFYFQER